MKKTSKKENPKWLALNISGGLGKNVMASAVVRALKNKYPKSHIAIFSPHVAAWENNPLVEKIINITETDSIYQSFIEPENVLVLAKEPYHDEDYIYRKGPLVEIWRKLCEIPVEKSEKIEDVIKPDLYFTEQEIYRVENMLPKGKPLFFIQTNGGAPTQPFPISWSRDLPLNIAQKVVDIMNGRGYLTVHLRRKDQPILQGAIRLELTPREALLAIKFSEKRLLIDSFAQHAAAAFNLPSVVCWIANPSEIFGYTIHKNIYADAPKQFRHYIDSYLEQDNITGTIHECPYDTDDIFSAEKLIKELDSLN